MRFPFFALLSIAIGLSCCCTHVQLRNNTIHQARSVADIHQQQVMDNLATFVVNPHALPYFSYAKSGVSDVTDTGRISTVLNWIASGFDRAVFTVEAQRAAKEGWTLEPINDPRKLELMRCAYQKVVQNCGLGAMSMQCPDCQKRLNRFYTGDPNNFTRPEEVVDDACLSPYLLASGRL